MKDSVNLSLPQERAVRGYPVKRMPLGVFLQAMQQVQDFPAVLSQALFPGMSLNDILGALRQCDSDFLGKTLARALAVAPEMLLSLIAKLTGIAQTKLENDPAIGMDGLLEIVTAWAEVNNLENFIIAASGLFRKAKALAGGQTGDGCKG